MKSVKQIIFTTIVLFTVFCGHAQIITTTISVQEDAHINSASPTINYGNSTELKTGYDPATAVTERFFLQFDLTSLPYNAIITSAKLKVYANTISGSSNLDLYVERVDSLWEEDSITWNNQPSTFFSDQVSISNSIASSSGLQEFDVTDHAQYFLNYAHLNNGWSIRLQDESSSPGRGISYHSSEYNSGSNKPELEIEYILPMQLSTSVVHCTAGNTDGTLHVDVSGGSSVLISSIKVHEVVRDNNQLGKASLSNVTSASNVQFDGDLGTIDASNLSPGVYRLRVDDVLYSNASDKKFRFYKYFLVAREGETTSGILKPSTNYQENVRIGKDKPTATSPTGLADINQSSSSNLYVSDLENNYEYASLIQYFMDFDDQLEFTKADLTIKSANKFYRGTNSSNATNYSLVTSPWNEKIVTWNTRPTVDPLININLPTTTIIGYDTLDLYDSVSILPFVEFWQNSPGQNHGFEMALENYNFTQYASRNYKGSASNKNFIEFEFKLKPPVETTFDVSSNSGSIDVVAPGTGTLPYSYILSLEPIGTLQSLWDEIKDSTYVDSLDFFRGKVNSLNHTFLGVPSEAYYLTVFDNDGVKVLDQQVAVVPSLELTDNVDLLLVNDELSRSSAAQGDGSATLIAELPMSESGGIEIEVLEFGDYIVGFQNSSEIKASSSANFEFGIHMSSNGLFSVIVDGVETSGYSCSLNSHIRIAVEHEDYSIYVDKNRVFNQKMTLPCVDALKSSYIFKGVGKIKIITFFAKFSLPRPSVSIEYPECNLSETGDFSILTNFFMSIVSGSITLINNETGIPVVTGSSTTTFSNLPIGTYTLTLQYSLGFFSGINYSEQIPIGYVVNWDNLGTNTQLIANPNTLYQNPSTSPFVVAAEYLEKSPTGTDNWTHFDVKTHNYYGLWDFGGTGNQEIFMLSESGTTNYFAVWLNDFSSGVDYIYTLGSGIPGIPYNSYNVDASYRITETDGVISLYHENNLVRGPLNIGTGGFQIFVGQKKKAQLIRTITSYCPFSGPDQYTTPKRKIEGGYYQVPQDNILKVEFYQEYNQGIIQSYNITDYTGANVNSDIGNPTISKLFGDNRFDFDVSGLANGFYTLELVNDKGESWFIRFKKG